MHHIVQENCFREENYNNLILALNRLNVSYEIVKVLPFTEEIKFTTKRNDIFVWGAVKLAILAKRYDWIPGSLLNKNHDFLIYKDYYKDHLLNYNSTIINYWDDSYRFPDGFFARPTLDSKAFTGQVFNREDFLDYRKRNVFQVDKGVQIQITGIKQIQMEARFWIVGNQIITASQYRLGSRVVYDESIEEAAYDFVNKMIQIFKLADAFVMDICLCENQYYIIECGCINSAGFYKANMQKLVMALEDHYC